MADRSMIFHRGFLPALRTSLKTVTRRPCSKYTQHPLKSGDRIYVRTSRPFVKKADATCWLRVKSVTTEHLLNFMDYPSIIGELQREGIPLDFKPSKCLLAYERQAIDAFRQVWDQMYAGTKNAWCQDPLVYRIEFKYIGDSQGDIDESD